MKIIQLEEIYVKMISQAENGVGAPVHARVALSVLFPPTIRLDPHIFHHLVGYIPHCLRRLDI